MKLLAIASTVLVGASIYLTPAPALDPGSQPASWSSHGVDDPPPLDCPMCGGDVELHRKRTKQLAGLRATSLLLALTIH